MNANALFSESGDAEANEKICRLFSSGDWRGMELLFKTYYKRLVVWADTFLEDMCLAEDTVQEFFMALWEKREGLRLKSDTLRAFLLVSVRNRCYHCLEKRDVLRNALDLAEVDAAFEEYNERHDRIVSAVLAEIESLPPRSREVMSAVFVKGMKYREVAEKYGISLSTVKTLLGNAIRKLRERFGSDGFAALWFFLKIKKNPIVR